MGGSKLVEQTLEKDLEVWISADMKCSQHCRYAVNKANKVLGMIIWIITYKHLRIMLNLYKTLVRPHVEYCVSAWSPYYKKDKELLENVQRRFTKMIKGMKGKSYEERLQKLNLWSLEERRNYSQKYQLCKAVTGLATFSTLSCIHNLNYACWHLEVVRIRSKNFIYRYISR